MSAQQQIPTPLLDALIARGLVEAQHTNPEAAQQAQPLPGAGGLPNPDPNSSPPLYGEPPGEGYLYAHGPQTRQAAMVSTTPDVVRSMILRTMEALTQNAGLPFNEEGAAKNAEAILKLAQAYLLIDPAVDAEGVPVAGKAMAQAAGQIAAQPEEPQEAHGTIKPGGSVNGAHTPPRVQPGAAANKLQEMHENAENMLHAGRGSRPLPRPRVGS